MPQRASIYDTIPGLGRAGREASKLPEITEAQRQRLDEQMRLAALGLTAEERAIVESFDREINIGFGPVVRR